jgi:hypothetical protein
VSQLPFRHSVQAKRDTESSIFSKFWMPTFVGMTVFMALFTIVTQSQSGGYNTPQLALGFIPVITIIFQGMLQDYGRKQT